MSVPSEEEYKKAVRTMIDYEVEHCMSETVADKTLRIGISWITEGIIDWIKLQPDFTTRVWMVEIEKEEPFNYENEKIKSKFLLYNAKTSYEKIKTSHEEQRHT